MSVQTAPKLKYHQYSKSHHETKQGDHDGSTILTPIKNKWKHPSIQLWQLLTNFDLHSRWRQINTAKYMDSISTSFDSTMGSDGSNLPSPCCCFHLRKQTNVHEKTQYKIKKKLMTNDVLQGDKASSMCLSNCYSIGSGWFFPETGEVVLTEPKSAANHAIWGSRAAAIIPEQTNPFLITVNGYSETDKKILSAEKLFTCMKRGEKNRLTENVQGKLLQQHDSNLYYGSMDQLKFLQSGGALYSFTCRTWMTPYEREMVRVMANLTCFENETRDNFVPGFDVNNLEDVNKYTYALQKAAYILPGVQLSDITTSILSSNNYHKCCQPENGTKIWDHFEENVFRFTRPIIPHIYRMTIQFRVSQVQRKDLKTLSSVLGVRVDKAILMERTKRSVPPKVDATAKAKSILCYTNIPGGLLVTHATVILNTAIPTVVAKVIDSFGGSGLSETCETAERTRLFFFKMKF